MTVDRRSFLKLLGAGAAGLPMVSRAGEIMPKTSRRVVVIGGGFGGSIAAKYIRMLDPSIEVILIERNKQFVSCPFSNLVIGGLHDISELTIGYDKLAANHGIKMLFEEVAGIDPAKKEVTLASGTIKYDRLVISPGVDFRFEEIEGYDPATTPKLIPHAWKAGEQTLLLKQQLESMRDGGTVLLTVPLTPYRCPPGPYERSSMIAMYLKKHKPKSKLIVLDANPDVTSKGPLFKKAWEMHYKGILEYTPAKKVTKVDGKNRIVSVEGLEDYKGDVVNLIPSQRAGAIAVKAGLVGADKNWCPVNPTTFESTIHKDIHVIGDACVAGAMPKSGFSANTQAKACATNLVALMNGRDIVDMSAVNTCYSAITEAETVSVTGVYKVVDGKIAAVPGSVALSPADFSQTRLEHIYAESWLRNILTEMST